MMKAKQTILDILAKAISFVILLLATIYAIYMNNRLPFLDTSTRMLGQISSKLELFIILGFAWILLIGLIVLSHKPNLWNFGGQIKKKYHDRGYRIIRNFFDWLVMLMSAYLGFLICYAFNGQTIPAIFTAISIALLVILWTVSCLQLHKMQQ